MRSSILKSRLSELIQQRNGYLVIASGLCVLCILLVLLCFILAKDEHIVELPPEIQHSFWVSQSDVSAEYLSEMTTFFAYLRLNVTPTSADNQRQILLRYVDPRNYGALNDQLVSEDDHLTQEHISTAFYPVDVKVDTKSLTGMIIGDLIATVGTTTIEPQRLSYQITYRYDNGRLLIRDFQEVKPRVQ